MTVFAAGLLAAAPAGSDEPMGTVAGVAGKEFFDASSVRREYAAAGSVLTVAEIDIIDRWVELAIGYCRGRATNDLRALSTTQRQAALALLDRAVPTRRVSLRSALVCALDPDLDVRKRCVDLIVESYPSSADSLARDYVALSDDRHGLRDALLQIVLRTRSCRQAADEAVLVALDAGTTRQACWTLRALLPCDGDSNRIRSSVLRLCRDPSRPIVQLEACAAAIRTCAVESAYVDTIGNLVLERRDMVFWRGMEVLGSLAERRADAQDYLIRLMQDDSEVFAAFDRRPPEEVRWCAFEQALRARGQIARRIAETLGEVEPCEALTLWAITSLAGDNDRDFVDAVRRCMSQRSVLARRCVLGLLGERCAGETAPTVASAVSDVDVGNEAASALLRMGDSAAWLVAQTLRERGWRCLTLVSQMMGNRAVVEKWRAELQDIAVSDRTALGVSAGRALRSVAK